jgi:hypothetical protein
MRKWVKYSLIAIAVAILGFAVLAGVGGYFVLRHLETKQASEVSAKPEFEAVRARFGKRAPMIEIVDLDKGDIKVQRLAHPEGLRANNLHVLTWDDGQVLRTDVPLWLMRFSSVNILSHLGIAPARYRLTVEDLKRFGPGLVVDYQKPGQAQVLIWLE